MTETPNRLVQKHHKHDVCFRFGVFAWPSDVGIACRILPVLCVNAGVWKLAGEIIVICPQSHPSLHWFSLLQFQPTVST